MEEEQGSSGVGSGIGRRRRLETQSSSSLTRGKRATRAAVNYAEENEVEEFEEMETEEDFWSHVEPISQADLDKLPTPESFPKPVTSEQELAKLGLQNNKLSDVVLPNPPQQLGLTPEKFVADFIIPASQMKSTLPGEKPVFETTYEESLAILKGMENYIQEVTPEESAALFVEEEGGIGKPRGEWRHGGWLHFADLCTSDSRRSSSRTRFGTTTCSEVAKKMSSVMKEGGGANVLQWTNCLAGYAFGFWLAKLYNKIGYEDEMLPHELREAKIHFAHLHGVDCLNAEIKLSEDEN